MPDMTVPSGVSGTLMGVGNGTYQVSPGATITVDPNDVPALLNLGFTIVSDTNDEPTQTDPSFSE
jgi:hypothetical protein